MGLRIDMEDKTFGVGDKLPNGATIESDLNKPDGSLPFGLYLPDYKPDPKIEATQCSLIWKCGKSIEGDKIVAVFVDTRGKENRKDTKYLRDMREARYVRDELIKTGWLPIRMPEVKFRFGRDVPETPK